jgi:phosphoglycolate phosphatase
MSGHYPKLVGKMTTKINTKRLILFDIDGTLLHPGGVGRASTREAMLEVFGTAADIDSHHFAGKTDWYTLTQLLKPHGHDEESIGQKMTVYNAAIENHIERLAPSHDVRAFPGALQAVERARDDQTAILGIVTGNMPTSANVKLRAAGFDPDWFVVGAYGDESTSRNDLPAFALERAQTLSEQPITPNNVYVIGDTVMDIACARAIQAVAVAVRTGFESDEALIAAEPDFLLDDLTTLFDIL